MILKNKEYDYELFLLLLSVKKIIKIPNVTFNKQMWNGVGFLQVMFFVFVSFGDMFFVVFKGLFFASFLFVSANNLMNKFFVSTGGFCLR